MHLYRYNSSKIMSCICNSPMKYSLSYTVNMLSTDVQAVQKITASINLTLEAICYLSITVNLKFTWAPWHLKSLFVQQFRLTLKKTSKLCITWPLWGKSTDEHWIPLTKGQPCRQHFLIMTSSCKMEILFQEIVVFRLNGASWFTNECKWCLITCGSWVLL